MDFSEEMEILYIIYACICEDIVLKIFFKDFVSRVTSENNRNPERSSLSSSQAQSIFTRVGLFPLVTYFSST